MICAICEHQFSSLKGFSYHISHTHNLKSKDYYDTYVKLPNEGLCVVCGRPTKYIGYAYNTTCSSKCTCLLKYGVEHNSQIPDVKNRMHTKEAHKKASKNKNWVEITKKVKATKLERYGDENYNNTKKAQQTNLSKIGKKSYLSLDDVHAKGVEASKTKEVHDEIKQTNLNRYGVENPLNQDWVIKKAHSDDANQRRIMALTKTNMDRYGVCWPAQNPQSMQKVAETNLARYGVKSFLQTVTCRQQKEFNSQKLLEQYLKRGFICRQELIHRYGQGWLSLHIPVVIENGIAFIDKKYIQNIEDYFYRDRSNRVKSKLEQDVYEYIRSIYKGELKKNCRRLIYPFEIDFYLPSIQLAIEIDGTYWHSDVYKDEFYHFNKSRLCEDKNVRLIHLYEHEWKNNRQNLEKIIYNAIYGQYTFRKMDDVYEVVFDGTGISNVEQGNIILCDYNYGYLHQYKPYYQGPTKQFINNHFTLYDAGFIVYKT